MAREEAKEWFEDHMPTKIMPVAKRAYEMAVAALTTLQIENQALRNAANGFKAENERLRANLEQVKREHKYSAHDVALILADAFGDSCACNFNGNDEWLPEKCELLDTCPNVVGVACWEQYLKWRSPEEG